MGKPVISPHVYHGVVYLLVIIYLHTMNYVKVGFNFSDTIKCNINKEHFSTHPFYKYCKSILRCGMMYDSFL